MTNILFVDKDDNVVGAGTKKEALEKGIMHRIIRIFLFNSKGELLIQKRSMNVDVPGRWDQSVGGHVDEGETYLQAAVREMQEEIGVQDVILTEVGKYYVESPQGGHLKKFFNMVYSGAYDGEVRFDEREVSEVRWIGLTELRDWMHEKPKDFTGGIVHCIEQFFSEQL